MGLRAERMVKVAVIGSGLAGLTAAHLLCSKANDIRCQDGVDFEVHLFEKNESLGMDASSISVPVPSLDAKDDHSIRINVPMRSFQAGYYPQLMALYKSLGVAFQPANFTYSFSHLLRTSSTIGKFEEQRQIIAYMLYNGSSGRRGISVPAILQDFAGGRVRPKGYLLTSHDRFLAGAAWIWTMALFVLSSLQLLFCYLWLISYSIPLFRSRATSCMSFIDWADESAPSNFLARWLGLDTVWDAFVTSVLVPLFSAVCTAPESMVLAHPVEEFLDYIWLTLGTNHYVTVHGVRDVVARLSLCVRHVHLNTPVSALRADLDDPALISVHTGDDLHTNVLSGFNHVVFATEAPEAAYLLQGYAASLPSVMNAKCRAVEKQVHCLRRFAYTKNIVVNHRDASLLPRDLRDYRDLNFVVSQGSHLLHDTVDGSACPIVSSAFTMATQIIALGKTNAVVYQTTNPVFSPSENTILSVTKLDRAVLTLQSKGAVRDLIDTGGRHWWETTGRLGPLQGAGTAGPGIWLCGSYAYPGIPLLEGCVASARNVVEQGIWAQEGVTKRDYLW
ncbi:hypothetical protein FISHEDRAFT_46098 [Fistulina hepatica ATCC 64428]|uniref:FAD/NAD(P)-binding domain-containing protein n=1 Tax=Fistulina hepatica ATCC 64428 TaxID=1128425 RepID=A0A0D7A882_9AGAR|nr:hypothetical protein FISHEDRAFT_46098 [Fistulina hepatica ATCC 64428]